MRAVPFLLQVCIATISERQVFSSSISMNVIIESGSSFYVGITRTAAHAAYRLIQRSNSSSPTWTQQKLLLMILEPTDQVSGPGSLPLQK